MRTFSAGSRVKVTDQSSQFRGHLGTVESRSGNNHQVRIDGHQVGNTQLLLGNQLQTTTQPCPVEYPE